MPDFMKFCLQDPIEALFALANFPQGCKGQRPKCCNDKEAKGQNLV